MNKLLICFSANRICHHDDYYLLISKIAPSVNVKSYKAKLKYLFSSNPIMFLDIDSRDLLFLPIIIIRTLWTSGNFSMSVRTEYLVDAGSFVNFIKNITNSIFIKSKIKRLIFLFIKYCSNTKIISIHRGHKYEKKMHRYVSDFIYDPQLWDLKLLNFSQIIPDEVKVDLFKSNKKKVLVAGSFNEQRSRKELIEYLETNTDFIFIIAGKIDIEDYKHLKLFKNCILINRYNSNEELFYLLNNCDIVYCFYTNNRPSGFFGRALQLNKNIIVRKNSFLHKTFLDYNRLVPVSNLNDIYLVKNNDNAKISYDSYDELRTIITNSTHY